jgi:hypothetical protein
MSSEDKMTRIDSFPGSISNSIELDNISLGQEVSQCVDKALVCIPYYTKPKTLTMDKSKTTN